MRFRRAFAWAVLAFLLLFTARLISLSLPDPAVPRGAGPDFAGNQQEGGPATGQKNYASQRKGLTPSPSAPLPSPSAAESQKYEKIATTAQTTTAFEADRKRVEDLIGSVNGIVQMERTQGLTGRRMLELGIGVPPDRFDGFVEGLRGIGRLTRFTVVKNDKTSEYLALRARRATLEQAKEALLKLNTPIARVEDSLNILNHLNTIEQELQALGVSLGDFDASNELCTVRLTLIETPPLRGAASVWLSRAEKALVWAGWVSLVVGAGLSLLACACLLGMAAFTRVHAFVTRKPSEP